MRAFAKALLVAGMLLAPSLANAQTYPTKPVTLVIPFSPGASNDLIGRFLADGLAKLWKQPVVVENRAGAGSAIGAGYVAKAKPDGYTLMFGSSSLIVNAAVAKNLPFDTVKDIAPIAMTAVGQLLIVTGSRVPMKTVADIVRQAKAQKLFYGANGASTATFAAEQLNDVAGIKMEPVHYKGGTEILVDMAGGRLDVYVGTVTSILPYIENKTVTPVAMAAESRSRALPDVPTVAEAGYPDAVFPIWFGLFGPAGIPPELAARINADVNAVMNSPEATQFLSKQDAMPVKMSVKEFADRIPKELESLKVLAQKHNIGEN